MMTESFQFLIGVFHHFGKVIHSRSDLYTRRRRLVGYDTRLILLITDSYLQKNLYWLVNQLHYISTTLTDYGCDIHV